MQSVAEQSSTEGGAIRKGPPILAVLVALVAFGFWMNFSLGTLMAWLWGPYARVFIDAGPLILSRGGALMTLTFLPISLVVVYAYCLHRKFAKAVFVIFITVANVLAYGYYLHHIVAFKGVDESMKSLIAEVGFNEEWPVPAHIAPALQLSNDLAKSGAAPWRPREWTKVSWPEFTTPKKNPL